MVEVEAPLEAYGLLLEEVRDTIGASGQLNDTLSQSLSWEYRRGLIKSSTRTKVQVSQRRGKTRIKITQHPGIDRRVLSLAAIIGGGFVSLGIIGSGAESDVFPITLVLGIAVGAGVFGGFRKWFRSRVRRKSGALVSLLDRLVGIVRDYGVPAMPDRHSASADPNRQIEG